MKWEPSPLELFDCLVVTELNRKYAFVVPYGKGLTEHRIIIGRYENRTAATRVAILYNRRQRAKRPGWVEVLQAQAVYRRAEELHQMVPSSARYSCLAFSPYASSGYFDVSHVTRPADRELFSSPVLRSPP